MSFSAFLPVVEGFKASNLMLKNIKEWRMQIKLASQIHLELLVESIDRLVVGKLIKDKKVIIAYTYILENSYIFILCFLSHSVEISYCCFRIFFVFKHNRHTK